MSDRTTVYALIAWDRYEPHADNTLRVFSGEQAAERWRCLLEAAKEDAHFPVTYAELKQEFGWIDRKYRKYDVVEHTVYENGYDGCDTDE